MSAPAPRPGHRADILRLLLQLREERGMTIIVATRGLHIAASAGCSVRLLDGRITEDVLLSRD